MKNIVVLSNNTITNKIENNVCSGQEDKVFCGFLSKNSISIICREGFKIRKKVLNFNTRV